MPDCISLEYALDIILPRVQPVLDTETVPLLRCFGRVCAEDIFSAIDVPSFDRSPLDGFSFNSADSAEASPQNPARLRVVETVYAGGVPKRPVRRGEAVKIMTGAMIPDGCDCVAPNENVLEQADGVHIAQRYERFQNYVFKASDFPRGSLLISAGEKTDFSRVGIIASSGAECLRVFRKPKVALFCSGDELTEPGKPLAPGKIYDSNYPLLAGRLTELGFVVNQNQDTDGWLLPDNPEKTARRIESCAESADMVITTGGVSVGEKDIFHEVFSILGAERLFWRVDFKPGMSTLCGIYKGKPLMCLSGNPFAALATFELLVRPALEKISSRAAWKNTRRRSVMKTPFLKAGVSRRFVRAFYDETGITLPQRVSGGISAPHSNAALFSLAHCNCLLDIPTLSPPLNAGDEVEVVLL